MVRTTQPVLPHLTPNDDVAAALALVHGALGEEEQRIRDEGAVAMKSGNYPTAEAVLEFAKRLLAIKAHVKEVEQEWKELEALRDRATPEVQEIVSKRFFGRKSSGEITSHLDFCRPILEVLVAAGGRARTFDVLDRVGKQMKGVLKPKDYEPHSSSARQIRWRNSAQWARNHMANVDGRMVKGSPTGIWEISPAGRAWLASGRV